MNLFSRTTRGVRLHTKFIVLLTGVSLVPLLVVSLVTLNRFQKTLNADAAKLGEQLAATASAEIKSFMVSQLRILDNVAALYQPEFPIEPDVAEGILENIMFRSENFSDISVVDTNGKEVARKNRLLVITDNDLRSWADTPAFEAVRERSIYIGQVLVQSGRPLFDLGIRIENAHGEFAGAVFAEVDARVMPSVVSEISDIVGRPGRVYIVNEKGIVIAHPDLSYVLGERDLSDLPTVRSVVEAPETAGISSRYTNEQGLDVLGSAHPMSIELFDSRTSTSPRINWFVIAEQPFDVIYGGAREAAIFSIIISFAAVILAALTAVFFAGRISHPIELLHQATQEFGRGNLEYRAPVERRDEIGALGKSFNTMAETIGNTMRSLKHEEEIVSAERNKLSIILSGITNAVIAVDLDNNIILFNKAAETLTGRHSDDVLGKPIQEIITLNDGDHEVAVAEYCPQHGTVIEGPVYSKNDLRMNDLGGGEHIVNLVSGRIREGANIQLGCILTFQDITREFVMDRTKREFVSIAAHQLRTPLTGMAWAAETLLSGAKGALGTAQKELVERGLNAIHGMVGLVNDLLNVTRIEEGRFGIKTEVQSLAPLLERVMTTLQKEALKKNIHLRAEIAEDLPPVAIDASKMEFVFDNIIDNAIKYTPAGGSVRVRMEKEGGDARVTVSDTGIGIPAGDRERVFTKFFRSQKALSYHTDGSGLGLYVARNIIQQHGGRISFETEEDKGTTFSIFLRAV
ncbi:hypothetical protein A2853_03700 [Candidatus Kaiserbacteria bacterium RIFCSPHIGHO2_01_FULL_55_17]|uniref:histidine kinase n=1 Tax=Candidatus Kaiserbacteria bacterium RIFCSPHIGHO2_01_FULL_55_17 TaxID=1798484 RepID=A0A1F6D7V1_9BACT|nr:MAG: hypothetical protein A2853_03700 [Candidatus Kaiserbacteria bacterium RIFCSPHIGHO2_01_FULL_55_17]